MNLIYCRFMTLILIVSLGLSSIGVAQESGWILKADMPTARSHLVASVIDGKIYVIGGSGNRALLSAVEVYDPATNTWARKADMPTARWGFSTSVVDGKIYAISGSIGHYRDITPRVEAYDPVTDTWTRKADIPTAR